MKRTDRPANIHVVYNDNDEKRYGIGVWDAFHSQYTRPLDSEEQRLTGCHTEFSRKPIYRISSLSKARRIARQLWGYSKLA